MKTLISLALCVLISIHSPISQAHHDGCVNPKGEKTACPRHICATAECSAKMLPNFSRDLTCGEKCSASGALACKLISISIKNEKRRTKFERVCFASRTAACLQLCKEKPSDKKPLVK